MCAVYEITSQQKHLPKKEPKTRKRSARIWTDAMLERCSNHNENKKREQCWLSLWKRKDNMKYETVSTL